VLSEAQEWIAANPEAHKEAFEDQLKELQAVCDPIVAKLYQQGRADEEEDYY
jgi:heat shock protein 5